MNKLVEFKHVKVDTSNSIIHFETVIGLNRGPNGRFLRLEGKRAYYLGTSCDTCPLLFERLEASTQKVSPRQVSDQLRQGLTSLDDSIIDAVKQILPKGDYIFCLLNILPSLVKPGDKNDYFCKEELEVWNIDQFWGLPHYPKTEYYRSFSMRLNEEEQFYEFEVPLYPQTWLEQDTVSKYQELFQAKGYPTALAISVAEVRRPWTYAACTSSVHCHWSLVHYLLDGHHKMNAAARENKPLSLLACIALNQGSASKDQIEQILEQLERQSV